MVSILSLFLQFFDYILELSQQCSIFYISFDITLSFYMMYDCVRNYFKSVF